MKAAHVTLLAACLVLAAVGTQGQSNCINLGITLRSSCSNVVDQIQKNAGQILSASCPSLRKAVQNAASQGVAASGGCCADIRTFIQNSCTCDGSVLGGAGFVGLNADTITASGYVAQVSSCGPICNPCGNGPCGCGGAAGNRRLLDSPLLDWQ